MSSWNGLLKQQAEEFIVMDKKHKPDGEGGFEIAWQDGAKFTGAIQIDSSALAKIAQAQGVKNLITILTPKSVTLVHSDIVRRVKNGKTYRITSDGEDDATPKTADLDIRKVSAEEWELANG